MPGDSPVNIGELLLVPWGAEQRVLGIQAKLHQWAARGADDFVVLVLGNRHHAEDLHAEVQGVLDQLGCVWHPRKRGSLTLTGASISWGSASSGTARKEATGISSTPIRRRGRSRPSGERSVRPPGGRPRTSTRTSCSCDWDRSPADGPLYFRHGSSSRAFGLLQHHLWWRTWRWLRKKHPNRNATWIIRHYYGPGQWWPRSGGIALFQPSTVKIERYRYRGTKIGNPWATRIAAP